MSRRETADVCDFGQGQVFGKTTRHIFTRAAKNAWGKTAAAKMLERVRTIGQMPHNMKKKKRDRGFGIEKALPGPALAFLANCLRELPRQGVTIVPGLGDPEEAQMLELGDAQDIVRIQFNRQKLII